MHHSHLRRSPASGSGDLVELLTTRQHLRPHQSVADALELATAQLGCCAGAVAKAIRWLDLDPEQSIGRLRRSELMQLGQSIARFCTETAPQASSA